MHLNSLRGNKIAYQSSRTDFTAKEIDIVYTSITWLNKNDKTRILIDKSKST